jgi:uncharacterized membrane protein
MAQRHRLFRLQWTYLRGWLVIAALVVLAKLVAKIFSEAEEWLEPYLASPLSTAWKIALVVVILLIVPWALGKLTEVPSRLLRTSRSMQMFRRMERKLTRELRPDESRGYRIALIDFPSTEVRTLGVLGSTFREPETGRELATVYLPGTPDPTKGSLMVVALDHLALTDWTLQDIIGCHVTFGSGSPAS